MHCACFLFCGGGRAALLLPSTVPWFLLPQTTSYLPTYNLNSMIPILCFLLGLAFLWTGTVSREQTRAALRRTYPTQYAIVFSNTGTIKHIALSPITICLLTYYPKSMKRRTACLPIETPQVLLLLPVLTFSPPTSSVYRHEYIPSDSCECAVLTLLPIGHCFLFIYLLLKPCWANFSPPPTSARTPLHLWLGSFYY